MHPEDIKAQLRKGYGSARAFERAENLPLDSVRDVLRGKPSRRTAEAIAAYVGKPIDRLFPGRFKGTKADNTSRNRDTHRLNGGAA
ncbi:MAG TPA: helix-turn-helix domain-containing protein [Caulobacteraceae bacterium]|nr:helix-turn-helix domain-containing protein [Caulobacteraceae bacterium]